MKIVINIPGAALTYAALAAVEDYSEEDIQKAIEKCNESPTPTEIDLEACMSKKEAVQLCTGLAIFAIAKTVEEMDAQRRMQTGV